MKNLAKSILFLLLFAVLTFASFKVYKNNLTLASGLNNDKNIPSETVRKYWELSAKGDFQEVENLVGHPPKVFWDCYFDTPDKCQEKKMHIQEKNVIQKSEDNTFVVDSTVNDSQDLAFLILKDQIPKGIYKGKWRSYSIDNQWVDNNEARIRVLISDEDTHLERDILLYKSENSWKIFRFTDINDRESYATPK